MNLQIIILAAGQGKRMYSKMPKVLHPIAGKAMITRVIDTAQKLSPQAIHVIYGHGGAQIKEALSDQKVNWIEQTQQLGTGHAVLQALPHLPKTSQVLILYADVPLIQAQTLRALIEQSLRGNEAEPALALLVATTPNPQGLGRIIRNKQGAISRIVEEKDANEQEQAINEIYTGICCASASHLASWLPQLDNDNAQKEYYLTQIIDFAINNQVPVNSLNVPDLMEVQGVNNRLQLQQLERVFQTRSAQHLLEQGVMLADAQRFDLRGHLTCGQDVFIDINCVFQGTVVLGDNCMVGPHCTLTDVTVGAGSIIYANSVLEGCQIEADCHIGPFARLRAGTQLGAECKIGNFVETKKAVFSRGSKASHLSYLGDVRIGKEVNIGAGTITCNYDGINKHETIIEDGAFIGSDTQLVAPVTVGAHATIGAGSTIRRDVPPGELTLTESKQKTLYGWKKPTKLK